MKDLTICNRWIFIYRKEHYSKEQLAKSTGLCLCAYRAMYRAVAGNTICYAGSLSGKTDD